MHQSQLRSDLERLRQSIHEAMVNPVFIGVNGLPGVGSHSSAVNWLGDCHSVFWKVILCINICLLLPVQC